MAESGTTEISTSKIVIPGLDPGIHGFVVLDGRVEPGHDE
jgi:hypothetical protein